MDSLPDCLKGISSEAGRYVVVRDGRKVLQTWCIHDARRAAAFDDGELWRLPTAPWGSAVRIG